MRILQNRPVTAGELTLDVTLLCVYVSARASSRVLGAVAAVLPG